MTDVVLGLILSVVAVINSVLGLIWAKQIKRARVLLDAWVNVVEDARRRGFGDASGGRNGDPR